MVKKILASLWKRKRLVLFVTIMIGIGFILARKYIFPQESDLDQAVVERGVVREELILSGVIQAEEHANLSFLSSGELNYVAVSEGQVVKKGEVLARLDSTNAYQTFLQAEADLRRYEASLAKTYDDVQGHEDDESFSQRENRTVAETNRDKAYRAFVIAQHNLSNLTLTAPFPGIVASITYPYGGINTNLTESQIELVNPLSLYFEVSADQSEITEISKGQKVIIVLDSFPEEEYEARVEYIGLTPKAGELGSVYGIKVWFFASSEKFRVGMTGDAKFVKEEKEGVLYVPSDYVNSDRGGDYVNLGKSNSKKYVKVGLEGEERTEITEGLSEGDTLYD